MSETSEFLVELQRLMENIPADLTHAQLHWALAETSLTLGSRIAALQAAYQLKLPIPDHTEGPGPRLFAGWLTGGKMAD